MSGGMHWCKENIKEPWKEIAIAQKMFVRDGFLPTNRITLPVSKTVVSTEPFFASMRKLIEMVFGKGETSMMSVITDGEKIVEVYFEPIKDGRITDFQELYPKNAKEFEKIVKEYKPAIIKKADKKFAELLYKKMQGKTTLEEKFLTFGLVLIYSVKKGYVSFIPEKGVFKAVKMIADMLDIEGFEEDDNLLNVKIPSVPVSYRLKYKAADSDIGNKFMKVEVDVEKLNPIIDAVATAKDMDDLIVNVSKEAIEAFKKDAFKVSPNFGFWKIVKNKTKDMDENIYERDRFLIAQAEKVGLMVGNMFILIAMEAGIPKKVIISRRDTEDPIELWEKMSDKYGYIDIFAKIGGGDAFKMIVPKIEIDEERNKSSIKLISKLKSLKFFMDLMPYLANK